MISSIEEKESSNAEHITFLKQYRAKIEGELKVVCCLCAMSLILAQAICNELISLVDASLLPNAKAADTRIFYFKMKGDYFRYLAEFLADAEHKVSS